MSSDVDRLISILEIAKKYHLQRGGQVSTGYDIIYLPIPLEVTPEEKRELESLGAYEKRNLIVGVTLREF